MMLEEAGAETVGTVIATLKPSDQSDFAAQVDGLVTLGFIRKERNNLVERFEFVLAGRNEVITGSDKHPH
jgi:hypothetical protein